MEIPKAIRGLATGMAPGPDDFSAEVYKNLPELSNPLAELYTQMIQENQIPREMCSYHILPFDKVGKDPAL